MEITTDDSPIRQRCMTTGCDNVRWEHSSYCRGHVEIARSAAKDKRKARRKLPDGGLKDMLTYNDNLEVGYDD